MMRIFFELTVNLIETLIIIDFLTRYFGCKYEGRIKYTAFIGMWLLSFAELSFINSIVIFEGVGVLINISINLVYALVFLNGENPLKLLITVLFESIALIIAIVCNLIASGFLNYDPNDAITVFNPIRVVCVIITKVILFYVGRLILKHKRNGRIGKKGWIVLILIPLISIFSLSALMLVALNNATMSKYIVCGMSGIVLADIATYYFFSKMSDEYESGYKIELLSMDKENAKKEAEKANEFVGQMRSAKHDIKNQLLIIQNYISMKEYKKADEYSRKLIEEYLPEYQSYISSDNDAFNAITNSKITDCIQKNIFISIEESKNALKNFDLMDTGILFGNLLDNAIEAAECTEKRKIYMKIKNDGNYLSIFIKNSINASVLEDNNWSVTKKQDKDNHGIGLKNIRSVVKKYNGMIEFYEKDMEFCCHILLDNVEIKKIGFI